MSRNKQMQWLLGLTALSLVPIYVLLGWQSGGHKPAEITEWLQWFWRIEAGAWGLRALVESAALIFLFQTVNDNPTIRKVLITFEVALIGLIVLTVGLVIVANGTGEPISQLSPWLYWVWSFGVAAFAPLMMGSVGLAYKVHQDRQLTIPESNPDILTAIAQLSSRLDQVQQQLTAGTNPVDTRRQKVSEAMNSDHPPTQKELAQELGVSIQTIRTDVKALNGKIKQ